MGAKKILQKINKNEALREENTNVFGPKIREKAIKKGKDVKEILKEIEKASKEDILITSHVSL